MHAAGTHTQRNRPDANKTSLISPKTSFIIPKAFNNPKTTGEIF